MEIPVLFINACVRKDSRTRRLADRLLELLDRPYEEIRLNEIGFPTVDEEFLDRRDRLISQGRYDDPVFLLARQFSEAEIIVVAAPY